MLGALLRSFSLIALLLALGFSIPSDAAEGIGKGGCKDPQVTDIHHELTIERMRLAGYFLRNRQRVPGQLETLEHEIAEKERHYRDFFGVHSAEIASYLGDEGFNFLLYRLGLGMVAKIRKGADVATKAQKVVRFLKMTVASNVRVSGLIGMAGAPARALWNTFGADRSNERASRVNEYIELIEYTWSSDPDLFSDNVKSQLAAFDEIEKSMSEAFAADIIEFEARENHWNLISRGQRDARVYRMILAELKLRRAIVQERNRYVTRSLVRAARFCR